MIKKTYIYEKTYFYDNTVEIDVLIMHQKLCGRHNKVTHNNTVRLSIVDLSL